MSQKIGIITFHAAYNFGSVLQAYATQQSISMLGFDVSTIDYRPKSQNDYYGKLYRTSFGIKPFIKDLMMMPARSERLIRRNRFESFIKSISLLRKSVSHFRMSLIRSQTPLMYL